jgi:HSP20 family protein
MFHTHNSFNSLLPGLGNVRRELEKAFEDVQSGAARYGHTGMISAWQDDEKFYVEIDVPGFRVEDLSMNFEDGNLTIRGERNWPEDRAKPDFNERRFGKFERVISLPDTVDGTTIDAGLTDGVLTVTFNKKVESVPQTVKIQYRGKSAE